MENRFGVKDLVFVVLLLVMIVAVFLKMKQDDRQGQSLQNITQELQNQARDLTHMINLLESGQFNTGPATTQALRIPAVPGSAFDALREAKKTEDYAPGDWLVEAFGVQPPSLTPIVSQDVYGSIVQARVLESLAVRDPDTLTYKPLIATGWQVEDNRQAWETYVAQRKAVPLTPEEIQAEPDYPAKEDAAAQDAYTKRRMSEGRRDLDIGGEADAPPAMTITFELRRNVRFSDGHPLTADDVIFTYQWIMNPLVAAQRERSSYAEIKSVQKLDDYLVKYEFKRPYFEAFGLAAESSILPTHFYSQFEPEAFNQSTGLLLGSGPYRLPNPESWSPGDPIELIRNERYWGDRPAIERLVYRIIENETAELTAFVNGEIDLLGAEPEQYVQMTKDKDLMARSKQEKFYSIRGGYVYIAWNQMRVGKTTRFADKRVRQAMTMMTPRQQICDQLFLGYAQVANGPFNPLSSQANTQVQTFPYDIDRARALLAEAGYRDRNGDGVLEAEDGTPFEISITYPGKGETYKRVMLLVRDSFAKAGIRLQLDPVDWPVLTKKLTSRDFDAITLGWSAGVETDVYQMFHSSQIADNADNFMAYHSPAVDRLIEQARQTLDEDKRMAIWKQVHAVLHEDQPYTFLFRRESLLFYDQRLQNVKRARAGLNYVSLWNMPLVWYVPADKQKYGKVVGP